MTSLTRSTRATRRGASSTKPIEAGSCRGWRLKHDAANRPRPRRHFDRLSAQRTGGGGTMAQHTATIANPPTPARPTRARRRLRELRPMLWFIPVLLLLLTVTLYPTLFVVWMGFQKTRFY